MQLQPVVHGVRSVAISAAVARASLWFRVGFFGGVGVAIAMAARLANGEGSALSNVATIVLGVAVAAFSLRRSWRLLAIADEPQQQ